MIQSILKNTLLLCLFGCLLACPLSLASEGSPVVQLFDKSYYRYEVKSGETLFSLSRRFQVTQEEMRRMNPSLEKGLKKDKSC